MKIIRHGYFGEGAFVCPECGCVFEVEELETDQPTFYEACRSIYPECPDCGYRCNEYYHKKEVIVIKKEVIVMKRLLDQVNDNTDIIIRSGIHRGEYSIRGVRYIDDSNKITVELLINLDEMTRYQYTEDSLWRLVCDELKFRLDSAELEYYARQNKKE